MLTCKDFLGWLNECLDDPANADVRQQVEAHIGTCPNCWVIFDTTKKTVQIYRGMEAEDLPSPVRNRLMDAIQRRVGGCGTGPVQA